jgi:hypothetical protein
MSQQEGDAPIQSQLPGDEKTPEDVAREEGADKGDEGGDDEGGGDGDEGDGDGGDSDE